MFRFEIVWLPNYARLVYRGRVRWGAQALAQGPRALAAAAPVSQAQATAPTNSANLCWRLLKK